MERKAGKGEKAKMSDLEYIERLLPGYECRRLITGISCVGDGLTDQQYRELVGDVKKYFADRFFEICADPIGYREFVIYHRPYG